MYVSGSPSRGRSRSTPAACALRTASSLGMCSVRSVILCLLTYLSWLSWQGPDCYHYNGKFPTISFRVGAWGPAFFVVVGQEETWTWGKLPKEFWNHWASRSSS